jgi:hypothetical protein
LFEKLGVEALRNLEDAAEKMLKATREKRDAEARHPGTREQMS